MTVGSGLAVSEMDKGNMDNFDLEESERGHIELVGFCIMERSLTNLMFVIPATIAFVFDLITSF